MRKRLFMFFLITCLLLPFYLFTQSRGVRVRIKNLDSSYEVGKQYLVLIAVNRYQNWRPLYRPVKNAEEIREVLETRYYIDEVVKLYDEKASKAGIMKIFKELQGKIKVEDSVIIFYAGHGYLDKSSNNGFWVPVDGGLDENVQERWIPNSIIRGFISQMKSKHILLISDSCFSGELLDAWREKSPKITHEYFKRAYKRRSRQVLTSGASERVPDNSEFAVQLKLALLENGKPYLDPLSIYNEIRWGIKDTLPMFGYLKGTNHQEGGAFLFFLKDKKTDKPADVKAVESKTGRKANKNNKGFWEIDHGDGIVMVYIPAGEFTMGSNDGAYYEEPPHKVYIDGYWLGKTEVTVKQFTAFVKAKNYVTQCESDGGPHILKGNKWERTEDINWKAPEFEQDDKHPVVYVSWKDAIAYCRWLSDKTGLTFKLPTEAEWEKAACGPNSLNYPWGNHGAYYRGKWYANYAAHDNYLKRGQDGFQYTAPVGSYPQGASPYGLLDMAGNVWEWCSDWYEPYYKRAARGSKDKVLRNPAGPTNGDSRVFRGGGWGINMWSLRCAGRHHDRPSYYSGIVGFRLCQDNK